jgi:hypothetical protein
MLYASAGTCSPPANCEIINGVYNNETITGNFTGTIASAIETASCASDASSSYSDIYDERATFTQLTDIIGGKTLTPGCYHQEAAITVGASTNITLDALGDPNAVFVIVATGALTLGANSYILLLNGTTYENVFWVIEGAVDVGAGGILQGTTLLIGALTLGVDAKLCGRGLAHVAAVTMAIGTSIFVGDCDV